MRLDTFIIQAATLLLAWMQITKGACPNKCSGHGRCLEDDVCSCMQNWTNGDCSGRVCPFGRAWQDTPIANNDAHHSAECSARGMCDRDTGICECDAGFSGSGCRRMACPDNCNDHGSCRFMEEASSSTYTLWDQEKIMTCKCDPYFTGHSCGLRMCPKGDDQLSTGQKEMVQVIHITGVPVVVPPMTAYFSYRDPYGMEYTTAGVTFDTTVSQAASIENGDAADGACTLLQRALRRLPNNVLNTVIVTAVTTYYPFERDEPRATTATGRILAAIPAITTPGTAFMCMVTFKSEPGTTGYQNLLGCHTAPHNLPGHQPKTTGNAAAKCVVTEIFPGATAAAASATRELSELLECSGRGQCDYSTGLCNCYAGHMGLACQKQEALV